jgi:hypothetical protein
VKSDNVLGVQCLAQLCTTKSLTHKNRIIDTPYLITTVVACVLKWLSFDDDELKGRINVGRIDKSVHVFGHCAMALFHCCYTGNEEGINCIAVDFAMEEQNINLHAVSQCQTRNLSFLFLRLISELLSWKFTSSLSNTDISNYVDHLVAPTLPFLKACAS